MEPPVGVDRLGGRVGAPAVAAHELRPADEQLALRAGAEVGARVGVDDPRLGARDELADGPAHDPLGLGGVG